MHAMLSRYFHILFYVLLELVLSRYPPTLKISRNTEEFDKDPEWPTNKHCNDASEKFPENLEAIYQIFLPFENKGIRSV